MFVKEWVLFFNVITDDLEVIKRGRHFSMAWEMMYIYLYVYIIYIHIYRYDTHADMYYIIYITRYVISPCIYIDLCIVSARMQDTLLIVIMR